MQRQYSRWFVAQYTALAFALGLVLLFVAYFIQSFQLNLAFSLSAIAEIHRHLPVFFFIDLIPIVFGGIALVTSKRISIAQNDNQQSTEQALSHQRKLYRFVEKLRGGEIDVEYSPDETDVLGKAIVNLRDTIRQSKEEEILRRKEDEQRHWAAEGLAKFGEILRSEKDDLDELSYNIISNLVKYIGAIQGGFYLLEDSDPGDLHFRLTACYAYERRKYADRRVNWGQGLVGACAMEKQSTLLKQIPDSYLNITSGLGKANPKNLLLVPLKINDEVHGVLETASFESFDKYHVDFVEKVAESIASTISNVKINIRTAHLLKDSQEQSEAIASQEEEMRQNMEELQATQEESARQAEKFVSFTNSVNHTLIRAEYDINGILQYANTKFLQKLEYSGNSEVEGKHISMFINKKDRVWFDDIWNSLSKGGKHFEGDMKHVTKSGKDLWTIATYTCVRNSDGDVEKILFLAIDTTEQKNQSLDYEGQVKALNNFSIKSEFTPNGDVIEVNEKFLQAFGLSPTDSKSKTIYDFVGKNERKLMEDIWDDVTQGIPFEGQLKMLSGSNEEKWYRGSFTSVIDMYNDVSKILFIAQDITREKLMEIETKEQTEQLKKQEEQLRQNEIELNRKLREAKEDIKNQFKEIEKVKIRNEKTLEGFLDAIITSDQDNMVQFFNKAAEELFGYPKDEIIGQNLRVILSQETIDNSEFLSAWLDPEKKTIVGERKEVVIKNKDGEELPLLILLSEAKVGRELTFTAFIQNISVDLF